MNYSKDSNNKNIKQIKSSKNKAKNKTSNIIIKILIALFLILGFGFLGACVGAYFGILENAPKLNTIALQPDKYTSIIYVDKTNEELLRLEASEDREYVTIDQIPESLQHAFVAIEDERFYTHNGVDLKAVVRSAYQVIFTKNSQGGSTITQQLIKNSLGIQNNTFVSKLQEQYLAVMYEKNLTEQLGSKQKAKDHILELYLNTINLGNNLNGVQTASKYYFDKDVTQLSIAESAVLAAITNRPTYYNPARNPDNNRDRQVVILKYMLDQGYITNQEYEDALKEDVYGEIKASRKTIEEATSAYTYFEDQVISEVTRDLQEVAGYSEVDTYNLLYSGGLQIYATIDPAMQQIVDEFFLDNSYFPAHEFKIQVNYSVAVKNTITGEVTDKRKVAYVQKQSEIDGCIEKMRNELVGANEEIVPGQENIIPVPEPQASFVLMDQYTGKVLAISGGRGEKLLDRSFNRATQALRQPGSVFKVVSAYAPGIDLGILTAGTIIEDSPIEKGEFGYGIKNWWGSSFKGPQRVRDGIQQSENIVTVKALDMVGVDTSLDYLQNFGFTTLVVEPKNINGQLYSDATASLALGGLTDGVTTLETAAAYATIANNGIYTKPIFYTRVLDHDGNIILDNSTPETRQVLKPSAAYILTDMMKGVMVSPGTGTAANFKNLSMPIAGKTGTTSDDKDLTFVAYTPYLTGAIWLGHDKPETMSSSGSYHLKLWSAIMEKIHTQQGYAKKDFIKPDGIDVAYICKLSGKLAVNGQCNLDTKYQPYTELFVAGTAPTEHCSSHNVQRICVISGKLATNLCPSEFVKYASAGGDTITEYCDVHTEENIDNGIEYYIDPVTGELKTKPTDVEPEYEIVIDENGNPVKVPKNNIVDTEITAPPATPSSTQQPVLIPTPVATPAPINTPVSTPAPPAPVPTPTPVPTPVPDFIP